MSFGAAGAILAAVALLFVLVSGLIAIHGLPGMGVPSIPATRVTVTQGNPTPSHRVLLAFAASAPAGHPPLVTRNSTHVVITSHPGSRPIGGRLGNISNPIPPTVTVSTPPIKITVVSPPPVKTVTKTTTKTVTKVTKTVAKTLGTTISNTTKTIGKVVSTISPPLGQAVTNVGQQLGNTVSQIPHPKSSVTLLP